jgi:SAM-dependent methyltransferase
MPSPAAAGFAKRVQDYIAGRPDYPPAVLAALPPAETIVELGAGTGKFTQFLIGRAKRIWAVEPVAEMGAHILRPDGSGVEVISSRAEAVPLPAACADLVCCATAYHWFDYPEAPIEIHRLLKPGGHLALIWNRRDDRVPWVAEFSKLLNSYVVDARRFGDDYWRQILTDPRFELVAEQSFPFAHPTNLEGIVSRALSTSYVSLLPADEQDRVSEKIAAIAARHPALRDANEIPFPHLSLLYLFRRKP